MVTTPSQKTPSLVKTGLRFVPATLGLAAVALLFGPSHFVARLGLSSLLERYRAPLGLCALVCLAALVAQLVPFAFGLVRRWLMERWGRRRGRKRLRALTRSERNLLKQYLSRQTYTLVLDVSSGATSALLLAGIIHRSVELDDGSLGLAFNIQPWALTYLRDNRHLLETSEITGARVLQMPAAMPGRDSASIPRG